MALALPIIVIGLEELLAVLGAGVAAVAVVAVGRAATEQQQRVLAEAASSSAGGGCRHEFSRSKDIDFICKSLGLDRRSCGNQLHAIKADNKGFLAGDGKRRNPDVSICVKCGLVVEANSGEELGHLG